MQGTRAEYVLIPYAATTLSRLSSANDVWYVLMADIFVTGYSGVQKILRHFAGVSAPDDMSVLQLGAGPVGLCAARIFRHYGFCRVVVDPFDARLALARR